MNLKQALKKKNKLANEINVLKNRIRVNNSYVVGTVKHYSAAEAQVELIDKIDELAKLKAAIHKANTKIAGDIALMAELKGVASNLRATGAKEGTEEVSKGYGSDQFVTKVHKADFNQVELDSMIESIEAQIDLIQDKLDAHNATTKVVV